MTTRARWTWLGDHLAVDFANTTIGLDGRREELIGTVGEFREWIAAEPAWLPALDGDAIDLELVLEQRDATSRLLRCAALQQPLPPGDVELVNARVRTAGVTRLLTSAPGRSRLAAGSGFASLLGVLAAATVDLLAREDLAAIAVCEAPGCGQVFHRSRRNQRWCSPGCGNRARVDRHRHRNPVAGGGLPR
ncbi:ABATE domain-containing protein [Leifsonia sp. NPDC080035]|uniref:ABATE domain-containing protein n=1 Tax=Leifsonia sp. NPDC080035 TaxID=3143936 RepID=A0AAU7GGH7_9MICO